MPSGFCLGGRGGGLERCCHDGSRWVLPLSRPDTASPFGDTKNDTPEVARLGVNRSGSEIERLADLFLAVEETAL